jgi:hypothetical protein
MATHRCGGIANDGRGWLCLLFDGEKKRSNMCTVKIFDFKNWILGLSRDWRGLGNDWCVHGVAVLLIEHHIARPPLLTNCITLHLSNLRFYGTKDHLLKAFYALSGSSLPAQCIVV